MNHLATADYLVFLVYFIIVVGYGYWIYQRKRSSQMSTTDFFLAEGSLTWWAIGASLIASNISAEHFIGMAGSGFAMGLAISSYEWFAAATLIIVAVFFIPIYLRNHIYTMPQFLAQRYSDTVSTILAIFWLVVYVLVNLSSILYLGAIAIESLVGISFTACTIGLAIFAIFITLGGMKVIGYTDVIQVVVLIFGGLVVTYLALQLVSQETSGSATASVWNGLLALREKADSHFHMFFPKGNPNYEVLPGMALVTGGMWLNNLYYWGCNQYIVQRALGADLKTARTGILFAAFLKLMIPLIVVIPGIAAYVLYQSGPFREAMTDASGVVKPDQAYPVLMNLLPVGMKGLAFAALTAAIVASLASKCNSISTIFTLDLYKKYVDKNASDQKLVNCGSLGRGGFFPDSYFRGPHASVARSGIPVHSGIHQLCYPRYLCHISAGFLLETGHQPGRPYCGYYDASPIHVAQILAGGNEFVWHSVRLNPFPAPDDLGILHRYSTDGADLTNRPGRICQQQRNYR